MTLASFLQSQNIPYGEFKKANITWDELMLIKKDYVRWMRKLKPLAKKLSEEISEYPDAHSVKCRIKSPDRLLAKAIRKKIANPDLHIDEDNYKMQITDLIGIRILHLYKEDWKNIHNKLIQRLNLLELPRAYVKKSDPESLTGALKAHRCNLIYHPSGYSSIHYHTKLKKGSTTLRAEIQVRTLLEEAWSEVDHATRYSVSGSESTLNEKLSQFNGLVQKMEQLGSRIRQFGKGNNQGGSGNWQFQPIAPKSNYETI